MGAETPGVGFCEGKTRANPVRHLTQRFLDCLSLPICKAYICHKNPSRVSKKVRPQGVKYASLYCNRGHALRGLSRLEYSALVQTVQAKNTSRCSKRKQNYPFSDSHVLASGYTQQLVAKQNTVIVCSKAPPHPGNPPSGVNVTAQQQRRWTNRANAFARYVLVLCRPETDCFSDETVNTYSYDWEALVGWLDSLAKDDSVLSKFRLVALHRRFRELRCSMADSTMLSHYRKRTRDLWTKKQRNQIEQDKRRSGDEDCVGGEEGNDRLSPSDQALFEAEHRRLGDVQRFHVMKALKYDSMERSTLFLPTTCPRWL